MSTFSEFVYSKPTITIDGIVFGTDTETPSRLRSYAEKAHGKAVRALDAIEAERLTWQERFDVASKTMVDASEYLTEAQEFEELYLYMTSDTASAVDEVKMADDTATGNTVPSVQSKGTTMDKETRAELDTLNAKFDKILELLTGNVPLHGVVVPPVQTTVTEQAVRTNQRLKQTVKVAPNPDKGAVPAVKQLEKAGFVVPKRPDADNAPKMVEPVAKPATVKASTVLPAHNIENIKRYERFRADVPGIGKIAGGMISVNMYCLSVGNKPYMVINTDNPKLNLCMPGAYRQYTELFLQIKEGFNGMRLYPTKTEAFFCSMIEWITDAPSQKYVHADFKAAFEKANPGL